MSSDKNRSVGGPQAIHRGTPSSINIRMKEFINKVTNESEIKKKEMFDQIYALELNKLNINSLEIYDIIKNTINNKTKTIIFLTLFMKGFTWNRELRNTFDLAPRSLRSGFDYLHQEGLIICRDFYTIDQIYQEVIFKCSPDFKHWIINSPSIYALSDKGKLIADNILNLFEEVIIKDSSLRDTFNFITQKTSQQRRMFEAIMYKEYTQLEREMTCPWTGVKYIKDTEYKREIFAELKELKEELILEGKTIKHNKLLNKPKQIIDIEKYDKKAEEDFNNGTIGKSIEEVDEYELERQKEFLDSLGITQ